EQAVVVTIGDAVVVAVTLGAGTSAAGGGTDGARAVAHRTHPAPRTRRPRGLDRAARAAAALAHRAAVALLARAEHAVAALRSRAVRVAPVAGGLVAVVAL